MERAELEEKIEELNDLATEVREKYRDYVRGCELDTFKTIHSESGQSIQDRRFSKTGDPEKLSDSLNSFEEWFSQSEILVKNFYPRRLDPFREIAKNFRRDLTLRMDPKPFTLSKLVHALDGNMDRMESIVNSLPARKSVSEMRFRKQVKENLALEEVTRAKKLYEDDLVRPSGVLAGVALERHLKTLAEESKKVEAEFDTSIKSAAEELKDKNLITETKRKELVHLADVRNNCAHADSKSIDEVQVEKMIESAADFIRRK